MSFVILFGVDPALGPCCVNPYGEIPARELRDPPRSDPAAGPCIVIPIGVDPAPCIVILIGVDPAPSFVILIGVDPARKAERMLRRRAKTTSVGEEA